MTTDDLALRNRANAARSTGPKTQKGKAASSQNARRHGATGAPNPLSVAAWLGVILGRPQIVPRDLAPNDEAGQLAIDLATAEARLAAAEAVLAEFEDTDAAAREEIDALDAITQCVREAILDPSTAPHQRWSSMVTLARIAITRQTQAKSQLKRRALLTRCAREARAARSHAIDAWSRAQATDHAAAAMSD